MAYKPAYVLLNNVRLVVLGLECSIAHIKPLLTAAAKDILQMSSKYQ